MVQISHARKENYILIFINLFVIEVRSMLSVDKHLSYYKSSSEFLIKFWGGGGRGPVLYLSKLKKCCSKAFKRLNKLIKTRIST